jgi:hypothetical protein
MSLCKNDRSYCFWVDAPEAAVNEAGFLVDEFYVSLPAE